MTTLWMKVECVKKLSCRKKSFCLRDQEKHTLTKENFERHWRRESWRKEHEENISIKINCAVFSYLV